MQTKYGKSRNEILTALETVMAVMKVEMAEALTRQRHVHAQGEFDTSPESREIHMKRMAVIFETSKVVSNCLVIEAFTDHIRKGLF